MRLCELVAPRAGSQPVPPSTSIGILACLEQRRHRSPAKGCALSPRQLSRPAPHLTAMSHATFPAVSPRALQRGRAEPPWGSLALPSPGCSSCQAAPCRSTPFRSRIRAITSAWHPALAAPTGEAWTSMSWVSRRTKLDPSWAHPAPARCCCPLLTAAMPFRSPSRHRPRALQPHPAGSAAGCAGLRCLGIPRAPRQVGEGRPPSEPTPPARRLQVPAAPAPSPAEGSHHRVGFSPSHCSPWGRG